jgi:CubicO group peptidase (beta-lactamase class C family)
MTRSSRFALPRPAAAAVVAALAGIGAVSPAATAADAPQRATLLDYRDFASRPVAAAEAPRVLAVAEPGAIKLPKSLQPEGGEEVTFDAALRASGTVAWIVLRDGRIVDERYYGGYGRESVVPSFSVAKSVVGTLVAIAQARGELPALDASIVDVLPELAAADRDWRKVTWRHLLDMRSGADFDETYRPGSDVARLYTGDAITAQALSVRIGRAPGKAFEYDSINTQLLAMALERAVGQDIATQLQHRLWQPMGAQYDATWSSDRATPAVVKVFCCLNARALDFARFGQLILERGRRDEQEVVPSQWVEDLLRQARTGAPYAGQWWLLRDAASGPEATALLAEGVLGQFVFVHPHSRLVIVRFGEDRSGEGGGMVLPWKRLFGAIAAANPPAPARGDPPLK